MVLTKKNLFIKASNIPAAGKGLFTRDNIAKGTCIIQYKGIITSWKDANHANGANPYIYYVNRNHVIDAMKHKKEYGRYVNDANGLVKVKGFSNNCYYVIEALKVFIEAKKDIAAGEEILVGYGKGYWDTIRQNKGLKIK